MLREEYIWIALMIYQAMPFSSSNLVVFQSCQHLRGPNTLFSPRPVGEVVSRESRRRGLSLRGHCFRLLFQVIFSFRSIFLRPFARQKLLCVIARMDALTSIAANDPSSDVSPANQRWISLFPVLNLLTIPSPTTPRCPRVDLFFSGADRLLLCSTGVPVAYGILDFAIT